MSEKNIFEGIGETVEFEIENTDALKELFNKTNEESLKIQKRFADGTYTEDDLLNHLPRFGLGTKDKIEMYVVESKYFEDLVNRYTNLKKIEKSHKEENGKLRVEFEKVYEDNLTLAHELEQEKEKNKELEKHQRQYLDGELITAKQGKFFEKMIKENYIRKDKIKAIVDENIPKQPNIITGEIEYTPNTNANSFLVQDILELLEER